MTKRAERGLRIHDLKRGARYVVVQDFVDERNQPFQTGQVLTFVQAHFLPYDGGHTLVFEESRVYILETTALCVRFDEYLQPCAEAPR